MNSFESTLCRRLLIAILAACGGGAPAWAQAAQTADSSEEREEFQDFYQKQKKSRSSFFASAPNHHITPKRDNISLAIQTDVVDVTVAPPLDDEAPDFENLDHRLEMTGWSVFPLVAFSSDRFGVGFAGEAGSRQIKFLSRQADSAEGTQDGYFYEQYSEMRYSGAGAYAFMLLRANWLPKWFAGTVILGGRSLTAIEESRGTRTDSTDVPEATKLKYDVNVLDGGLNIGATLAKRFTVFPWVNYRRTILGAVKDRNGNSADSLMTPDLKTSVDLDRSLTWRSEPKLTYGLDFAVQIRSFEVHLGGLFGYLANMNRGADRVQDETIELGISYDFKSR